MIFKDELLYYKDIGRGVARGAGGYMCPRAPEGGGAKMRVRINNFILDFDAI